MAVSYTHLDVYKRQLQSRAQKAGQGIPAGQNRKTGDTGP